MERWPSPTADRGLSLHSWQHREWQLEARRQRRHNDADCRDHHHQRPTDGGGGGVSSSGGHLQQRCQQSTELLLFTDPVGVLLLRCVLAHVRVVLALPAKNPHGQDGATTNLRWARRR